MKYENPIINRDGDELIDKYHWLVKFRRAKSETTLDVMVKGAMKKYGDDTTIAASIYLAECHRSRELESGRLLKK